MSAARIHAILASDIVYMITSLIGHKLGAAALVGTACTNSVGGLDWVDYMVTLFASKTIPCIKIEGHEAVWFGLGRGMYCTFAFSTIAI